MRSGILLRQSLAEYEPKDLAVHVTIGVESAIVEHYLMDAVFGVFLVTGVNSF